MQHAQVLVFLFHCLPMMQKKTLLVRVSLLLPPIAKKELLWLTEQSPLGVTRILLFVDYFLHHFYDPPALLTEQVQFNLLQVFAQPLNGSNDVTIKYCSFQPKDSPKNYNGDSGKAAVQINQTSTRSLYIVLLAPGTTQPIFYNLAPSLSSGNEAPKVDGLACSFLTSTPEAINYNDLYDACVKLLCVGTRKCTQQTVAFKKKSLLFIILGYVVIL